MTTILLSPNEELELIVRVTQRVCAGGGSFRHMSRIIPSYPQWSRGGKSMFYETRFEDMHIRMLARPETHSGNAPNFASYQILTDILWMQDNKPTGQQHPDHLLPKTFTYTVVQEWEDALVNWLSRFPETLVSSIL